MKKLKSKRMVVSPRKKAVREADKQFSLYIRDRDGNRCVQCGSKERITCGHLFTRAAYSTRWDEGNAAAQCSGCNLRHEYDFYSLYKYFVCKYGQDVIDSLHALHKSTVKYTTSYILAIADKYRNMRGRIIR
jgi:hypothetical protein